MKKLKIITGLFIIVNLFSLSVSGQSCFVAASVGATNATCTASNIPRSAGCDDLATQAVSVSNEMTVVVRENTATNGEQFGWDDLNSNAGVAALQQQDATLVDVALVDDANHSNCWAIIVYYSNNVGDVCYEIWQWGGSSFSFPVKANEENDRTLISITDKQGRTLFIKEVPASIVSETANKFTRGLSEGIYDFRISDSTGKNLLHQQIIKM